MYLIKEISISTSIPCLKQKRQYASFPLKTKHMAVYSNKVTCIYNFGNKEKKPSEYKLNDA